MSESKPTGWEGADRWFAADPGGSPEAEPEPPPAAPPACEVCGAELEADQTYCLECGSPTSLAPRLRRSPRAAAIVAAGMVVLGLGAGALAYAVVRDDGSGTSSGPDSLSVPGLLPDQATPTLPLVTETVPTTGLLPPDTSVTTPTLPDTTAPGTSDTATGFDTVTGPSSTPTVPLTETSTPPPTTTESTPPVASGGGDWPAGTTAWTAVLASLRTEATARSAKSRVVAGGDPAGVLFSSDFSNLRPGYWVVFSGRYGSREPAIAQAARLKDLFPTAYARRVEG
jgi:hypothetical protein